MTADRLRELMTTDGLSLDEAEAKLHNLIHSDETKFWYAYASGHGCSMATGEVDIYMEILDYERRLRELINLEKAYAAPDGTDSQAA
ncbi:MAG TPA: hypothetical protein VGM91_21755 [Conexibacter sp.]|jgi:hypothetical protein